MSLTFSPRTSPAYERDYPPTGEQDAYERIRSWIARPGCEQAWSSQMAQCTYYDSEVHRCAIGGALPLNIARSLCTFDGGIEDLLTQNIDVHNWFAQVKDAFLSAAQNAHDFRGDLPGEWQAKTLERLDKIAEDYGLDVVGS